jgi:AraC-like DNA-binding protein
MDALLSRDWYSTISLLGAAQGLFLAALLIGKRQNSLANRLLAVAMLAFSVDLATTAYYAKGLETAFPHFIGMDFLLAMLYGPVIYLYAKALSEGEAALRRRQLLHFLPFVLMGLCLLPFYLQSGAEKLAFRRAPEQSVWMEPLAFLNHVKVLYALVYLVLTFRLLRKHRARIKGLYSSIEHVNLAWLNKLLIGGLITWGIAFLFHLLWMQAAADGAMDPIEGYGRYVSLAVAVFVYAIGYLGLRQPEIFSPTAQVAPAYAQGDGLAHAGRVVEAPGGRPRYAKSGMDPDTAQHHLTRLQALMERDKLYRNSTLTLQDLAAALDVSAHNLSEVINTQHGQSFYDFVNGYRVREVQDRLAERGIQEAHGENPFPVPRAPLGGRLKRAPGGPVPRDWTPFARPIPLA